MEFGEEILNDFTVQAKENLTSFEDDLLTMEKQGGDPDEELINKVFRVIHSIKGGAGFLGLENMKNLTHVMETLLSKIRSGDVIPNSDHTDALLEGADHIGVMLDDIENSDQLDVAATHEKLSRLLGGKVAPAPAAVAGPQLVQEASVKSDSSVVVPGPSAQVNDSAARVVQMADFRVTAEALGRIPEKYDHLYALRYDLTELNRREQTSPVEIVKLLSAEGEIIDGFVQTPKADLRDGLPTGPLLYNALYATWLQELEFVEVVGKLPKEQIDEVSLDQLMDHINGNTADNDAGPAMESTASENTDAERMPATKTGAETVGTETPSPPTELAAHEPESTVESEKTENNTNKSGSETVRINVGIIDKLMTLAGELVLMRNQFLRSIDMTDSVSRSLAHGLDIVTSELQENIMATRMQPIGNVFGKYPRVVRDMGKSLGKNIEIEIVGSEVELDKTIVEAMGDPLTHLIRNSCDHGIESGAERESIGKSATGHILLSAFHEGGQINIEIKDDGKGIDIQAVRNRALEKGLHTEAELENMGEKEIYALLFLPGFSTAKEVSDISGRGVGLDVVKTAIQGLGGTIEIESAVNEGTAFFLRLPLTLAIIPCLIVQSGKNRFAIPQVNVEELVSLYDEDIYTKLEFAGDREVYRLRNRLLSMVHLSDVLSHSTALTPQDRAAVMEKHAAVREKAMADNGGNGGAKTSKSWIFAVLKMGSNRYGLTVDRILGTEEIVVKPMHGTVKSLDCYSGATVMGDGQVALILDVDGLAHHMGVDLDSHTDEGSQLDTTEQETTQTVLLFESGKEEQFAVNLASIRRIERIKFSNIEMVGDREFISIENRMARVMRMEQLLNVSPVIEADEGYLLLPKDNNLPYGFLISKLIDIVETGLDLDTESYSQTGLLGSSIIRERMTLFLDMAGLVDIAEQAWTSGDDGTAMPQTTEHEPIAAEDTPPDGEPVSILAAGPEKIKGQIVA